MVTSILEFLNGECKNKFFLKLNTPIGSLDISTNMFMTKYQIDLPETMAYLNIKLSDQLFFLENILSKYQSNLSRCFSKS